MLSVNNLRNKSLVLDICHNAAKNKVETAIEILNIV